VVVASGGGTFADADSRALMLFDGIVVWLDVPLVELIPRIPLDGRRPLAATREQLEQLYAARVDTYRLAPVRVDASGMPVPAVVDMILDAVHRLPPVVDRGLPDG
jgi:shikimate kinase